MSEKQSKYFQLDFMYFKYCHVEKNKKVQNTNDVMFDHLIWCGANESKTFISIFLYVPGKNVQTLNTQ